MSRRARGEGSIYRRRDGRFEASLQYRDASGRTQRPRVYGHTRQEASRKLDELKLSLEGRRGGPALTVKDFLESWLWDEARLRVRPTTHALYRRIVELHLVPALGAFPLASLDAQAIEGFLATKRESGLAPSTVGVLRVVLRTALVRAQRLGLLAKNPAAAVPPPVRERKEARFLRPEEASRLVRGLWGTPIGPLVALALCLGLRAGELRGLRWEDIDLPTGRLTVSQNLQRVDGELLALPPKSEQARRTLPLPPLARESLLEQRHRQELQYRDHQGGMPDLVFTTRTGKPYHPANLDRQFRRALIRLGLQPFGLHRLRHTCAAFLISSGVDIRVVMEVMGHANVSLTANLYGHVLPAATEEALGRVEQHLLSIDEDGRSAA